MPIDMDKFNANLAALKKIEDREKIEVLYAALLTRIYGDVMQEMSNEFINYVNTIPLDIHISSVTK